MKYIFYNQKLIPETQGQISIQDRGFMFGDGVFETCRISNGKIYNFNAHQNRLSKGLKALMIDAKIGDLEKKSIQLIQENQVQDGILRITITRGSGSLGYLPIKDIKALTIIQTLPLREPPEEITLGISKIIKPAIGTKFIIHKTANALPYVLTKISAHQKGYFDDILLDYESNILETSSSNIFWIKDSIIYTPDLSCNILPGTMRLKLIELLQNKGYELRQVRERLDKLKLADEVFLTNSTMVVMPVRNIHFDIKHQVNYENRMTQEVMKLVNADIRDFK